MRQSWVGLGGKGSLSLTCDLTLVSLPIIHSRLGAVNPCGGQVIVSVIYEEVHDFFSTLPSFVLSGCKLQPSNGYLMYGKRIKFYMRTIEAYFRINGRLWLKKW